MSRISAQPVSPGTPVEIVDPAFMKNLAHRVDIAGGGTVLVEAKIGAHGYRTVGTYTSADFPPVFLMLGISAWRFTATVDNATVDIASE